MWARNVVSNGELVRRYEEFARGVRGDMNARRRDITRQVFEHLDKDAEGLVTKHDLEVYYNVSSDPSVKQGKLVPAQSARSPRMRQ